MSVQQANAALAPLDKPMQDITAHFGRLQMEYEHTSGPIFNAICEAYEHFKNWQETLLHELRRTIEEN